MYESMESHSSISFSKESLSVARFVYITSNLIIIVRVGAAGSVLPLPMAQIGCCSGDFIKSVYTEFIVLYVDDDDDADADTYIWCPYRGVS